MDYNQAIERIGEIIDGAGVAVIVLIRTFLSFSLEVELTGRWPWQSDGGLPPPGIARRLGCR